jgi:hypothetical protein
VSKATSRCTGGDAVGVDPIPDISDIESVAFLPKVVLMLLARARLSSQVTCSSRWRTMNPRDSPRLVRIHSGNMEAAVIAVLCVCIN